MIDRSDHAQRPATRAMTGIIAVLLWPIVGCEPVVQARYFEYAAAVTVDGARYDLRGHYACYLDHSFLSPAGPHWMVQRDKDVGGEGWRVALRGAVNGTEVEVQPRDPEEWRLIDPCEVSGSTFDSRIFYRKARDENFSSYDPAEGPVAGGVTLEQSKRTLLREGYALHGDHLGQVTELRIYYTVSVHIMAHDEIDRFGLRQYVSTTPSARLGKEPVWPLSFPSRDTTTSSTRYFAYSDQVRKFLRQDSSASTQFMEVSASGDWRVGKVRQWAPAGVQGPGPVSAGALALDFPGNPLPRTCWVVYENYRIEVPVLFAQWRHVYDPSRDALVILTPVFADLAPQ